MKSEERVRHQWIVYFGFWRQFRVITLRASVVWPCSLPASQETRWTATALPFLFPMPVYARAHTHVVCPGKLLLLSKVIQKSPTHLSSYHVYQVNATMHWITYGVCSICKMSFKTILRKALEMKTSQLITSTGLPCASQTANPNYLFFAPESQHETRPKKMLRCRAWKTSGSNMCLGWTGL